MKKLMILLIFFSLTFVNSEDFGYLDIDYTISGDITNLNPYPVFIAIPIIENNESMDYSYVKSLPIPNVDVVEINVEYPNTTIIYIYKPDKIVKFNGKYGFWLPPYTTAKLIFRTNYTLNLNFNYNNENTFRVLGPAVLDKYEVIDLNKLFSNKNIDNIKLDNFKLTVFCTLRFNENTVSYKLFNVYDNNSINIEGVSLIIPAPIILNDYSEIYTSTPSNTPDIWINYYDWYNRFIESKYNNIYNIYNENNDDWLDSGSLLLDDEANEDINLYYPAVAFTTTTLKPIDFYYTVYWKAPKPKFPNII
ncbi:hypothetical protein ACPB8Q_03235 [Methanocaldococcus indicus]|uniref:hypothetical protein n=1 Tax=Methanocaldococcus indicus TaxID=213231 RepID=UPI003C6D98BA